MKYYKLLLLLILFAGGVQAGHLEQSGVEKLNDQCNLADRSLKVMEGHFRNERYQAILDHFAVLKEMEEEYWQCRKGDILYYVSAAHLYLGDIFTADTILHELNEIIRKQENNIDLITNTENKIDADLLTVKINALSAELNLLVKNYAATNLMYRQQDKLLNELSARIRKSDKAKVSEKLPEVNKKKDLLMLNRHYAENMALPASDFKFDRFKANTRTIETKLYENDRSDYLGYHNYYSAEVLLAQERKLIPGATTTVTREKMLEAIHALLEKARRVADQNHRDQLGGLIDLSFSKYYLRTKRPDKTIAIIERSLLSPQGKRYNFEMVEMVRDYVEAVFLDRDGRVNPVVDSLLKKNTAYFNSRLKMSEWEEIENDREILFLKKEHKRTKLWTNFFVLSSLSGVVLMTVLGRRIINKNKKELDKLEADKRAAETTLTRKESELGKLYELNTALKHHDQFLELLNKNARKIGRMVNVYDSKNDFLLAAVDSVFEVINQTIGGVDTFIIAMVDPSGKQLIPYVHELAGSKRICHKSSPVEMDNEEALSAYSFMNKQVVFEGWWTKNFNKYLKVEKLPSLPFGRQSETIFMVPLTGGEGIISIQSYQVNAFSADNDDYEDILRTIGETIMVACGQVQKKEELLKKKEELLKKTDLLLDLQGELSHRMKNHLLALSSRLDEQMTASVVVANPLALRELTSVSARIKAIQKVHELLDRSYKTDQDKDQEWVDAHAYFTRLKKVLLQDALDFDENSIGGMIELEAAPRLYFEMVVELGLVIVELILNINEHAYPAGAADRWAAFSAAMDERELVLSVADRGVGFELGDLNNSENYGLRLLDNVVGKKYDGKWEFVPSDGAGTRIDIRIEVA